MIVLLFQAMKQWWQLKSENFDTILFFKVCKHRKMHLNTIPRSSFNVLSYIVVLTWEIGLGQPPARCHTPQTVPIEL